MESRKWWCLVVCSLISGLLASCTCVNCYPSSQPAPEPWVTTEYRWDLASVERPADASQRYGAQQVTQSDSSDITRWLYEDELVQVLWVPSSTRFSFRLRNKSAHSIRIVWDEAAFVNIDHSSHPVMHVGIRYNDCAQSKPPSVVVRGGVLDDVVIGCDRVRYGQYIREWMIDPVLEARSFSGSIADSALVALKQDVTGKTVRIQLPIQIEDVVNDYLFTFAIGDVVSRPCRRLARTNTCF